MKKITVLLLLTLPMVTGFAQSAKLTNAINYLKDYRNNGDLESLQKAKENIELIASNPETKDPAKVQKVRGDIYIALFESNLKQQTDKLASISDPTARTLAGYKNTSATELDEAVKAFKSAKENDKKGIYALDISNANVLILNHYFNMGNGSFGDQKFDLALQMYEKASALDESNDSSLLNNLAASALYAKKYDKAKASFTTMAERKIGGASTYSSLMDVNFNLKDTTAGLEAVKKGRTLYPSDSDLLNAETNYYLSKNKSADALKNLNTAIAARPNEATLYLVRGGVYDKLANPEGANGTPLPAPANAAELLKSCEEDYKKAVSLFETKYKPGAPAEELNQYVSALFNLGIHYFNSGAKISKAADDIKDNAKFAAQNKKANDEFNKALPFIEKAHELRPDKDTNYALKQIYTRLEMSAKLKSLNDQLKN
ncbi:MAG TPA: hypothetical protein PK289_06130 [Bacteroidia bacterium]|nr:hypothetical protein [Bacteroidia bacterium]HRG53766.1 hypothetical protein [Bacteroidia bacterium]